MTARTRAQKLAARRRRNRVKAFMRNLIATIAVLTMILGFGFIGGTERETIAMLPGLMLAVLSFAAAPVILSLTAFFE